MKGKFITFEGIDGSGKSTQLRMLAEYLRNRAVDFITTCEPGGTELGRQLRRAFLETTDTVAPMAELLSFAADRAQHVEHLIKPALDEGKLVISDRYADATYAYQGAGRGFPAASVLNVIELATGGLKPDLTLFFDITVDEATRRMSDRSETEARKNRMDEETVDFYTRVRDAYIGVARSEPERFHVIDAAGPVDQIHEKVIEEVLPLLEHVQKAGR
ncbi:MAG: dTMP kinase [Pyrinomonadaceae bacterium]